MSTVDSSATDSSTTDTGRASVPVQPGSAASAHRVIDLDAPRPAHTRTDRVRDALHAGACVLAGVLITTGFALDPHRDTDSDAALIQAVTADPGRFYWANTIAAVGLVLLAAVGLAVLRLVRHRARVLATVAGMLLIIGGAAAAAGIFMYGAVLSGMVESGQSTQVSVALQESLGNSARPGLAFVVGFPGFALGMLLAAVALAMSRATPRWVPATLLAGLVWTLALGEGSISWVGDLLLTAALTGIGLALWKATAPGRQT